METLAADEALDAVLAIQFTIAWAGEARCTPPRLGWWETDLIDDAAGGDFFERLLPRTHAWAALEAVREAGRRSDAKARGKMADPDKLRTPFFLGSQLDEQLGDRLRALKRGSLPPAEALRLPLALTATFSRDDLTAVLRDANVAFTVVPGGRQLEGPRPDAPDVMIRRLAGALVPLAERYPLPFFKTEA